MKNNNNNKYWARRAMERQAFYHKNSDKTIKLINKAYEKAIHNINKDIHNIYYNYVKNYDLTPEEAKKLLNEKISNPTRDMIKEVLPNIKDEKIKNYMRARLNQAAYKARISRLEALKNSININCKAIADVELQRSTSLYLDHIDKAFYRNAFDIQRGIGIAFDFATMDQKEIQEILMQNWSGKHYSKRIWDNTEVLANKLQETITSGLMSGKSSKKMAVDLIGLTKLGQHVAERLIRTETTYITNAAELKTYEKLDIKKYMFVATLDLRTSEKCQELDGKIFLVKNAVAGENMPPCHPYCRSTTRAYMNDSWLKDRQRRARGKDGKTYIIKGNITYKEWYKQYIEG